MRRAGSRLMSVLLGTLAALAAHGGMAAQAESSGVDLVVSGIVPSATEAPKVLVIVRNVGTLVSRRPVNVELKLDDQLLGRGRTRKALEPGKPEFVEFTRPMEIPRGMHSFTAAVDTQNEVSELNEQNNEKGITIWARGISAEAQEEADAEAQEEAEVSASSEETPVITPSEKASKEQSPSRRRRRTNSRVRQEGTSP